jgi:hypothetical protein
MAAGGSRQRIGPRCHLAPLGNRSAASARPAAPAPHQINLQRSVIDRTINRFASISQLFGFAVGTGLPAIVKSFAHRRLGRGRGKGISVLGVSLERVSTSKIATASSGRAWIS